MAKKIDENSLDKVTGGIRIRGGKAGCGKPIKESIFPYIPGVEKDDDQNKVKGEDLFDESKIPFENQPIKIKNDPLKKVVK